MTEKVLIDTDVIIDYLRGNDAAIFYLESANSRLAVSVITVAELFSGVREGKERETLDVFLSAFELTPLTEDIAVKGGLPALACRESPFSPSAFNTAHSDESNIGDDQKTISFILF